MDQEDQGDHNPPWWTRSAFYILLMKSLRRGIRRGAQLGFELVDGCDLGIKASILAVSADSDEGNHRSSCHREVLSDGGRVSQAIRESGIVTQSVSCHRGRGPYVSGFGVWRVMRIGMW